MMERNLCSLVLIVGLFLLSRPSCLEAEEVQYGSPVKEDERRILVRTDYGAVSAVDVDDGYGGTYHLQFISLEPNCLFLPVLLHSDMVFYVHTGKGSLSWIMEREEESIESNQLDLESGDVYRIEMGSIFYIRSQHDSMGEKLRIYAFFGNVKHEQRKFVLFTKGAFDNGAYSDVTDLIRGFDEEVLQMGFKVSEEVIENLKRAEKPPSIIPYLQESTEGETDVPEDPDGKEEEILEVLVGGRSLNVVGNKKKKKKKKEEEEEEKKKSKSEAFNIFKEKPDFENCYGSRIAVTEKDLKALKGSEVGVFMVNLTKGAMMGPHWNPTAVEVTIVTQGEGMVQIMYPTSPEDDGKQRRNTSLRAEEGDVFVVPRYHPAAQMSFNNGPLVLVGFTTMNSSKKCYHHHPHYLFGRRSVFQVLDKDILALSFNVPITTVDEVFSSKDEAIIVDCTSCAEEVERRMEESATKRGEGEGGGQEKEEDEKEEEEGWKGEAEAMKLRKT